MSSSPEWPPLQATTNNWRFLNIAFVLFLIVYGFACVKKGAYNPPKDLGTDFTAYYSAGELARKGENIYDYTLSSTPRRPFIYPPMFAVFPMAPLSLLPHNTALAVYYALNAVLLLAALWLLKKILFANATQPIPGWWRAPEAALAVGMVGIGRYWDSNAKLSNANVVILFLLVLGLYFFHKKRDWWGGVIVALATTFKVTPGLFGVYFLWSRRSWAMAGGAAGLIFFLLLLPVPLLGWNWNMELLGAFARSAAGQVSGAEVKADEPAPGAAKHVEVGWGKSDQGQFNEASGAVGISLRGTFQKVLSPIDSLEDHTKDGHPPVGPNGRKINIANMSLAQARTIANILGLALLIVTVALTVPKWSSSSTFALALSWSLITVTMLLISPLTRKAHCVVLLIPAVTLMAGLQREYLKGGARTLAWVALGLLFWAGSLTSPDIVGDYYSDVLHTAGCHTLALLGLYAALAFALWKAPRENSVSWT